VIFKNSIFIFLYSFLVFQSASRNTLVANPSLNDLPDDMVVVILKNLAPNELWLISRLSKRFHDLTHRPEVWQDKPIQLHPENVRKILPNNNFPVKYFKALEENVVSHLNNREFYTRSAYPTEWKSDDLKYIANFPHLKTLKFSLACDIRKYAMSYLNGLTELQELHLNCRSLKNKDLENIENLTKIKILSLHQFQVLDEEGLNHIRRLTKLEQLIGIESFETNEVGLNSLNTLPNRQILNIIPYLK